MAQQIEKLIAKAHDKITRTKGREYAPNALEIENEINKLAQQTALTWFYLELQDKFPTEVYKMYNSNQLLFESLYLKAKAMEKEQIKDAYWNGTTDMEKEDALLMAEDYFKQYYNK